MHTSKFKFSWKRTKGTAQVRNLVIKFRNPLEDKTIERVINFIPLHDNEIIGGKITTTNASTLKKITNIKNAIEEYIIELDSFVDFDTDILMERIYASSEESIALKKFKTIESILDEYDLSGLDKADIRVIRAITKNYKGYEKSIKKRLTIKNIDCDFMPNLISFLIDKEYSKNYIKKMMIYFTRILKLAIDKKLTDVLIHLKSYESPLNKQKLEITKKQIFKIHEIKKIQSMDFSGYKPQNTYEANLLKKINLNDVRDWIFINFHLCQRHQSLKLLTDEQIQGNKIVNVYQPKTNKYLNIPILGDLVAYFENNPTFPPMPERAEFAYLIRIIARESGLTDIVRGTMNVEVEGVGFRNKVGFYQRWELFSTHSLRRSGISHLKLIPGVTNKMIMSISGHSSEVVLNMYDNNTNEDYGDVLARLVNQNGEKMKIIHKSA